MSGGSTVDRKREKERERSDMVKDMQMERFNKKKK
jgi:hypothetical protein